MQLALQCTLPRDSRYVPVMRHLTRSLLRELRVPSDAIYDVQLALSEACANVVRHATGSEDYSIRFSVDGRGCQIDVVDLGPGFAELPSVEPPSRGHELEGGRGLVLIEALVDELQFLRDNHRNSVRLVKRWPMVKLEGLATTGGR